MSNVKYAFATGGTPITTWLINQIEAVLEFERVLIKQIKLMDMNLNYLNSLDQEVQTIWSELEAGYSKKINLVRTQVEELSRADYDIKLFYGKKQELNLEDSNMD